jgi:hypothetical protein
MQAPLSRRFLKAKAFFLADMIHFTKSIICIGILRPVLSQNAKKIYSRKRSPQKPHSLFTAPRSSEFYQK